MTAQGSDRRPDTPSTTGKFSVKDFGKRLMHEFTDDRVPGLASEVAYSMVFAIPPLLLLLVTTAAIVDQTTGIEVSESLNKMITERAPGDAQALLTRIVDETTEQVSGGALSFGLILSIVLALWGGSGGINALVTAFNIAYEVEDQRSFVHKLLMRLGLTLAMIILIVLSFTLFVFGGTIGEWIADRVGLGGAFTTTWNILRWPVAAFIVLLLLAFLYFFGPNVKQSWRWVSPGSAVATALWILAILGIQFYLKVANPGSAFGAAGGVIVLLFFLYVTGIVFILGAEINSIIEKRHDPVAVQDMAENPQKVTSPEAHAEADQRARELGQPGSQGGGTESGRRDERESGRQDGAVLARGDERDRHDERGATPNEGRSLKGLAGMVALSFILDKFRGRKKV